MISTAGTVDVLLKNKYLPCLSLQDECQKQLFTTFRRKSLKYVSKEGSLKDKNQKSTAVKEKSMALRH